MQTIVNPFEVIFQELTEIKKTVQELKMQEQEPQAESDQLYTREEAKNRLRISSATLWRYEKQKKIKSVAIGGKRYFRKSDLENALK